MDLTIEQAVNAAKGALEKCVEHLSSELQKIRAGKASPAMLNGLMVSYYGNPTPLNQVANVSSPDARTLTVQPWEKSMLAPIEQSIFAANLGVTPQNDGETIRISIPPLTEERRKELVKQSKAVGEDSKVSVRTIRREIMDAIKKQIADGFPEDQGKREEEKAEAMIKNYVAKVEEIVAAKEKDIMTI